MEKNTWEEYSQYILITIEKLARGVEETNKEHQKCKEKTLGSLNSLKILLLEKIQNATFDIKKDIDPIVRRIEGLIASLSTNVSDTHNEFETLKENIILPLRIKVAVISIICGAIGGLLITLLTHMVFKIV